jgi:hypothetical protein
MMINAEIIRLAVADKGIKVPNARVDRLVVAAATDKARVVKAVAAANNSKVVAKEMAATATLNNRPFMLNNN